MIINKKEWENLYNQGKAVWNNASGQNELMNTIKEYYIAPCTVLDIGCGTGSLCIELSKYKFNATGIDISPRAIQIANNNKFDDKDIEFKVGDIYETSLNKKFDFVVDLGCFHYYFDNRFVEIVDQHLHPKGLWYSNIGSVERRIPSPNRENPEVPPAYSIQDIITIVNPYFEVISIKTFNIGDVGNSILNNEGKGFSFWSCLMRKR